MTSLAFSLARVQSSSSWAGCSNTTVLLLFSSTGRDSPYGHFRFGAYTVHSPLLRGPLWLSTFHIASSSSCREIQICATSTSTTCLPSVLITWYILTSPAVTDKMIAPGCDDCPGGSIPPRSETPNLARLCAGWRCSCACVPGSHGLGPARLHYRHIFAEMKYNLSYNRLSYSHFNPVAKSDNSFSILGENVEAAWAC